MTWYPGYNSPAIFLRLRCGSSSCSRDSVYGYAGLTGSYITLNDFSAPGIGITGGPIVSGWQRGTSVVSYDAYDNSGIKIVRGYLDGQPRTERLRNCNYNSSVPCPNGGGTLALDTTGLADGAHTLMVTAIDTADNSAADSRTIYSDNTPPASPGSLVLDNGDAWRPTNTFSLRWSNPSQTASPIVAVAYTLCPAANAAGNWKGCTNGATQRQRHQGDPRPSAPGPGSLEGLDLSRRRGRKRHSRLRSHGARAPVRSRSAIGELAPDERRRSDARTHRRERCDIRREVRVAGDPS